MGNIYNLKTKKPNTNQKRYELININNNSEILPQRAKGMLRSRQKDFREFDG